MSDAQILEMIAAGTTKDALFKEFGYKPTLAALMQHGYTWTETGEIEKQPAAQPMPEPAPATVVPHGLVVKRKVRELTPSQEEYKAREKLRLRECLKLRVKLPPEISPYSGWRRDPRVPGYAYHPQHGYVRYLASDRRQKIGEFAVLADWRGKHLYRVRTGGKRIDRYLDGLRYDVGHSSHNPYLALGRE
jgi:hypothetical protein